MNQNQKIKQRFFANIHDCQEFKLPILRQIVFKRSYDLLQQRNNKHVYESVTQPIQPHLIQNYIQKSQKVKIKLQGHKIILEFHSQQYFSTGSYTVSTSNNNIDIDISINQFLQLVQQVLSLKNSQLQSLLIQNCSYNQVFDSRQNQQSQQNKSISPLKNPLEKILYQTTMQNLSELQLYDLNIMNLEFINYMNLPLLQSLDLSSNKIISLRPLSKINRKSIIGCLFLKLKQNPVKQYQFNRIGASNMHFDKIVQYRNVNLSNDRTNQLKYSNGENDKKRLLINKNPLLKFQKIKLLNFKIQFNPFYTSNSTVSRVQILEFTQKIIKSQPLFRKYRIKQLLQYTYNRRLSYLLFENDERLQNLFDEIMFE